MKTVIKRTNRRRPTAQVWCYKTKHSWSRYYSSKEEAIAAAKQNGYEVIEEYTH